MLTQQQYDVQNGVETNCKRKSQHTCFQDPNTRSVSENENLSPRVHNVYTTTIVICKFPPKIASVVFKLRSKNIECKTNRKSRAMDMMCRLCKSSEETQEHIINCPCVKSEDDEDLDIHPIMGQEAENNSGLAVDVCERIRKFHEKLS